MDQGLVFHANYIFAFPSPSRESLKPFMDRLLTTVLTFHITRWSDNRIYSDEPSRQVYVLLTRSHANNYETTHDLLQVTEAFGLALGI